MKKTHLIRIIIAGAAITCAPSDNGEEITGTGTSTSTGNAFTISGNVEMAYPDSVTLNGVEGIMYRITYGPSKYDTSNRYHWERADTVNTDSNGAFVFQDPDTGYYSIVFQKGDISAFSGYFRFDTPEQGLVIGPYVLDDPITITGLATAYDTISYAGGAVHLIGTHFAGYFHPGEIFTISNIPKGHYKAEVALANVGGPGTIRELGYASFAPDMGTDTLYTEGYENMPDDLDGQQDSLTISQDTVSVRTDEYLIQYTID